MRAAEVFVNGQLAGKLTESDQGDYTFAYTREWFDDASKPAVSLTLPKRKRTYHATILFPFFFNLLSEGVNRRLQSRALQIDENDHFGLLLATAQDDTVGAITVSPIDL